jgi:hypothetical protein
MSIICFVMGISAAQIVGLRQAPSLATDLAKFSQTDFYAAQRAEEIQRMTPEQRKQFEDTYSTEEAARRAAPARKRLAVLAPFEQAICLENSWHVLHYLFTGHIVPADSPGDLLMTGEDLGEDVGYGPARLHDEVATKEFGRFIGTQDVPRLQSRVDLKAMADLGVYGTPFGPDLDPRYETALRTNAEFYFLRLRDYVSAMVNKGNGLLVWLS